ncbi:MAG: hypothetical protein AAF922_12020 [Pseudomonadota bacterium]
MEVLGLSHPVVSTATATMQKLADQARPTASSEITEKIGSTGAQSAAAKDQMSLALSIDDRVRPVDASRESLLYARTPVDTLERRLETDAVGVPENETYEFPEELPMNFLEMIDMWRVDRPAELSGNNTLDVVDPASAAEAQRLNRTA